MHFLQSLSRVSGFLGLARRQFEADSSVFADPHPGLTFSTYTSDRRITFRVAIPDPIPESKIFDTVLQIVSPKDVGWAGWAWGGHMTYNPLAVVWVNGAHNVMLSSRIAYGYFSPPAYGAAKYTILPRGTHINATYWQITAKCTGCSRWGDDDAGYTELDPAYHATMAFSYSNATVDNPRDEASNFGIHESLGHPIYDLAAGKNADFAAKVEKAAQVEGGGGGGKTEVGYAMTFWDSDRGLSMGWRYCLAASFIPAFLFVVALPFMPESPRWLVEHGKPETARSTLHFYREDSYAADNIHTELAEIERSVASFPFSGLTWKSFFTDPSLFVRVWRAALLQFTAQMCGATVNDALALAYSSNSNSTADFVCVIFVFIYSLGYSMGFGPAAWVYGSESFPTAVSARGLSFAASGGAVESMIVSQVWPVGIANLGSKIYFFFMATNLMCVPIIYLLYPETKGRLLEDMDALFGEGKPGQFERELEPA
ncbi:hypothetical protein VTI74DRAFT_8007 [Chaetomium olivicolor]